MTKPLKIGLTGSIGMGKSTTAAMFGEAGVPVWDADAAVARLYAKGGAAVGPVGAILPAAIVDGAVSKQALKLAISADRDVLTALERIVHPLVQADRETFLQAAKSDFVLFDIPLLFETGAAAKMDVVVVVSTPAHIQRERVMERGTMDDTQFDAILARQMPDAEKREKADFVIITDTLENARRQVHKILDELKDQSADA